MLFDLLKEMYFEGAGYDVKRMKQEKIEKEEMKKRDTIIFTKMMKHIIRAFGILYVAVAILCISSGITNANYIEIIKYTVMMLIDLAGMIFVSIKNKLSEIIGLSIIVVFILLNFVVPII